MGKVIENDGNITTEAHYDNIEDKLIINTVQEVEPVIEQNRRDFNDAPARHGEFTRVASIPLVVVHMLMRKGIWGDRVAMKRWLNDPENKYFRTRPGTV